MSLTMLTIHRQHLFQVFYFVRIEFNAIASQNVLKFAGINFLAFDRKGKKWLMCGNFWIPNNENAGPDSSSRSPSYTFSSKANICLDS